MDSLKGPLSAIEDSVYRLSLADNGKISSLPRELHRIKEQLRRAEWILEEITTPDPPPGVPQELDLSTWVGRVSSETAFYKDWNLQIQIDPDCCACFNPDLLQCAFARILQFYRFLGQCTAPLRISGRLQNEIVLIEFTGTLNMEDALGLSELLNLESPGTERYYLSRLTKALAARLSAIPAGDRILVARLELPACERL